MCKSEISVEHYHHTNNINTHYLWWSSKGVYMIFSRLEVTLNKIISCFLLSLLYLNEWTLETSSSNINGWYFIIAHWLCLLSSCLYIYLIHRCIYTYCDFNNNQIISINIFNEWAWKLVNRVKKIRFYSNLYVLKSQTNQVVKQLFSSYFAPRCLSFLIV